MKHKVKQISETLYEVLGYSVKIQTKKGRKILLCSCQNSSRFIDNNFCSHKELVLKYIYTKPIKDKLERLIKFYEEQKEIKLKFDAEVFLEDLKSLNYS